MFFLIVVPRHPPTRIEMGIYAIECAHLPRDETWCEMNEALVRAYFEEARSSDEHELHKQVLLYADAMHVAEDLTRMIRMRARVDASASP